MAWLLSITDVCVTADVNRWAFGVRYQRRTFGGFHFHEFTFNVITAPAGYYRFLWGFIFPFYTSCGVSVTDGRSCHPDHCGTI